MKKILIFSLVLGVALVVGLVGGVGAVTPIYVDDDCGTTQDGTIDNPYCTINDALVAATTGDTIEVAAGTYTNDIWDGLLTGNDRYRIKKSVTLLGAQAGVDPNGLTSRGEETILVRTNGVQYSLYASDITIDGFMIGSSDANTGGRLIISDVADNAIIRNCIIQNTPSTSSGHGVYIYSGADNALVEYNTFSNTAWEAIASYGASNAVITHNYISNSGQHAIQFMGHSGSDNEISYNHISGIVDKNAIQYWGGSGAIITHNMIVGEGTMYDGIWLDAAADESTVSNNQIFDTVYAGINVRGDCTDATVTYNNISGCGTGVDVVGSITGTVINFNAIHGNGMGVSNYYSTDIINAEFNWWGDDSGPTHSTNPSGIGDAVSDNVDFTPWWNVSNEEVVKIDIKPGSDTNSINLGSKGVVSVAVLTTNYFDVSTINEATVTFAGAPQVKVILEDRDGDGDLDMVFHFRTQDLGLDENSTEATLCGDYSYNEILTQSFRGTDTVNIVPTKTSAKKQKQNSMMNQDSESASYTTYHGNGIYSTTHLLRKDEIKPEKAPKKAVTQGPTLYKLMGVKWASTPDYVAQSDLLVIAATASITTWNNATEFGLLGVGSVNADIPFEAFDEDGKLITDGFNSYTYGNYPLSGVIAVCRTWWNAAGEIIEYDIMFDDDFAWGDATDDSTVMDLQNIATHEIGHAFGLLDLYNRPSVEQTMYGYSGYGETKKRDLEVGDIAGIQALYGNN